VLFAKLAAEKTDLKLPAASMVQILDRAVPGLRPVRPNKPLNIILGVLVGGLGGLFLATLVYILKWLEFRRASGVPRPQFSPQFRAILHVAIALIIGVVIGYHLANPLDLATLIIVPLSLVLGGMASAYIELANPQFRTETANPSGQVSPSATSF
jgi:hypothetical protein